MSGPAGEKPGTKILDYISLGFILVPPAVGVDMYLKDGRLEWARLIIATVVCWFLGAILVLASHRWQSWREADGRILPFLVAAENKFWVKGLIVASSVGGALALSSFLARPPLAMHDPPTAEEIAETAAPIRLELEAEKRKSAKLQSDLDSATKERDAALPVMPSVPSIPLAPAQTIPSPAGSNFVLDNTQDEKIVLTLVPEYLFQVANEQSNYDSRSAVILPYLGKWLNIRTKMVELKEDADNGDLVITGYADNDMRTGTLIMTFDKKFESRLLQLRKGDEFSAQCQITSIDPLLMFLKKCAP
jgi:hypothetical protein